MAAAGQWGLSESTGHDVSTSTGCFWRLLLQGDTVCGGVWSPGDTSAGHRLACV